MRVTVLVLLAACGRFGFAEHGDALASDGAPDGAPLCAGLICDNFEAPTFDARWMLDTFHGTLALDTAHAHSGVQSVHSHVNAIVSATNNARATLLTYDQLPVTGTIYVRMWVYYAGTQPTGFFDQTINLADAAGDGMSTGFKDGFIANNDYTAPTQYTQSAVTTQPTDGWMCLMFSMPTGIAATSRVWINGTEVTDVAQTVASAQPQPDHIYLGTEWVGTPTTQAATDAWIDDVIVGTSPLSCN